MFMAASWHLPVRELQGRKALIGIIRSSVTSTCPPRDVSDDLVSVFTQLTGSYQHRVPRPCGLLGLLGLPAATPSRRHPGSLVISSRFAVQRHIGHSCVTLARFLFPVQIHAAFLSDDEPVSSLQFSFTAQHHRAAGRRTHQDRGTDADHTASQQRLDAACDLGRAGMPPGGLVGRTPLRWSHASLDPAAAAAPLPPRPRLVVGIWTPPSIRRSSTQP